MSLKNMKKRTNDEPSDQSPPKKQKKQKKEVPLKPEISNDGKAANGVETAPALLTPKQRKRQASKNRKRAAIAKVKEEGGTPKPLWPAKKVKKPKVEGETKQEAEEGPDKKKIKKEFKKDGKNQIVEEQLKAKQEKHAESKKLRQEKRQQTGQYKTEQVNLTADEIRLRIAEIKGRGELSKTAKRKLGVFIKKLAILEGTVIKNEANETKKIEDKSNLSKSEKRRLRRDKQGITGDAEEKDSENGDDPGAEKPVDIQVFEKKKKQNVASKKTGQKPGNVQTKVEEGKIGAGKKNQKQTKGGQNLIKVDQKSVMKTIEKTEDGDEDESEDEDEDENEVAPLNIGEEVEESGDDDDEDEEEEEEEDDDDDDDDDDDEDGLNSSQQEGEEEDDGSDGEVETDNAKVEKPVKKEAPKEKKGENKGQKEQQGQGVKRKWDQEQPNSDKKKRYILFVGNLPFESKPEDVKTHFLTKVGAVSSVRIPTKPGTQTPRGFGYVEVTNDVDYEKGLSLHHSFLNGRRINVEYTLSGSKQVGKRQELVSKNQKLHAMRKAGKLAGSQKHDQKRSVRRFKKREQERQPQ